MARVFISYKRNAEPDESFSVRAFDAFREDGHEIFIDRATKVGTAWAEEIETNVRQSDFLIILLTPESSQSEMVRGEVEIARNEADRRGGNDEIKPAAHAARTTGSTRLNKMGYPADWIGSASARRAKRGAGGHITMPTISPKGQR